MKTSNGVKKQKKPQSPEKSKPKDHRELGRELDLFSFHEVSPGAPFWHYKGMLIVKALEKFIRELQDKHGYEEISTPIMVKKELFEKSGHWEFFKDDMFYFKAGTETYALKPMNCPESALVYQTRTRSYRDLPLRLAEIGRLHRNELSGVLGGLLRVRQITMDDAHIYCRFDQIKSELVSVLKMTEEFYKRLGLPVVYGLATRPKKAMGSVKTWKEAEKLLGEALEELGLKYQTLKGEGAFYGPKIHFDIKDSLDRTWTIATAQLDFQIPERFQLEYIDADGQAKRPVIIHRAIFGSFERFIGILLEHFKGALPFWLSPVQVAVLAINDQVTDYSKKVFEALKNKNVRAELDLRNESVGKKIREAELQKIPYLLIIGEKEAASEKVAVRERGKGDIGQKTLEEFWEIIK
ncbi:threonine--tRNA ligase [Candidatus Giovannonibacteria bacterium RIFCSPHIGHO2_01_FULL_48_47]|nr:MAG: threonine--tRNA ligase [Candidatus Giovannonibacteria bacterium RIFCSPHIGHO2_01_FULL_48_47]OGF68442.1 MAG: threonine--tRNA ligase [Candidatus Giovannonibacteria bacterium RIFCSPHIGHO2_02_FULL_48_15]OGF95093.1 MAG: threonine--tRNA ligase [Candidatus Giovannonibacteria bacterium RIFOXYC1_FULL_48_8]OGF96101.1 MAG: threonine--tRNA ligase [Candidatus Giovannonibacteria bacterium RIFOXYD1_FULL_48_21]HBT81376.1 threonine--tRNA ligase [Candidatus Giovannonibacteria bacterium]